MKPLDLYTLLYVIGAISLLFAFLMLLFHKLTPMIKGPLHWALGSFSAVLGALLFAGYPTVTGYWAYVVSAISSVMAISFYLAGIQLFVGKKVDYRCFYGLVISEFVLSHFFYLILPLKHLRMISFSVVCVIGTILVINELLKHTKGRYKVAFILCSVVFAISGATSLFRIVAILIWRPAEAHTPLFANLLFYFFTNVTQALLMFTFLLLISVKIAEQIEHKVEDQRKFYSIISHDLSGPIGMINVMLNLVNHDNEVGVNEKKQVALEAEKLSSSTYQLLQNLLIWSRNQLEDLRPKITSFDLDKVIRDIIELMHHIATMKGITVYYTHNAELFCMADVRMVETVIRNLVSNAVKFTNAGGTIRIVSETVGKSVRVTVSDNGIGMSEEDQKVIFSARERISTSGTSGEKGSGLGLMICREFVEANLGSIHISSQKNEGTEITIVLPAG